MLFNIKKILAKARKIHSSKLSLHNASVYEKTKDPIMKLIGPKNNKEKWGCQEIKIAKKGLGEICEIGYFYFLLGPEGLSI